ncbi:SMP-30/gluconolactonase/LRE family protein [Gordonia sp. 'Campus']|uniref:SMP-30/gluconolactonase/LRE family protein n=1 Tax=Gordonia sp. 'Campus' TaxID=2915824 RepID=UPI0027E17760|nr:SMP-30/gluconolactonase/LRE family protein [Gordonia sp. 'Campus']
MIARCDADRGQDMGGTSSRLHFVVVPQRKPGLSPARRDLSPPNGDLHLSELPRTAELHTLSAGTAEDVVVSLDGSLVCGVTGGAIVRVAPSTGERSTIADTGGRPLGLEVCDDGRLLVCDAHKGLLRVDQSTGAVETLVDQVDGVTLRFCSNAAAGPDGTVWFTESTDRFDFEHYMGALLEHRPSGRLFRRDPDGTVTTVLDGLYFPNGVALAPDRRSLLFTETGNYSLSRLWLTGPRQGEVEVLLSNMHGFPDNMSRFVGGRSWIAMTNPRNTALDRSANWPGFIRSAIWRLPDVLRPNPETIVWAICVDPEGRVVDEVRGVHPSFDTATGAVEHDGALYLASVWQDSLLSIDLSDRDSNDLVSCTARANTLWRNEADDR